MPLVMDAVSRLEPPAPPHLSWQNCTPNAKTGLGVYERGAWVALPKPVTFCRNRSLMMAEQKRGKRVLRTTAKTDLMSGGSRHSSPQNGVPDFAILRASCSSHARDWGLKLLL